MHGCSVGTTLSGDDDLAEDASCSTRAAGASPSRGDASPGFSSDLDGSGAPGDDWETAARDRAASSRLAESTGLPSRSPLGRGAAARRPSSDDPLLRRSPPAAGDIADAPGPGSGSGPRGLSAAAKRKATDRCASLSRPASLKTQRVERPASASAGASEDGARASSGEDDSDVTAKPATPDPASPAATAADPATSGGGGGGSGSGSEGGGVAGDAVDTATALKGVLEGLALDGSCDGDDNADVPDGALAAPLLRHQRRAVSWMRRREAAGSSPRGGLLADDQGLGKTFSAIALIVSNPPPPRWFAAARAGAEDRPAGGTLVVCPTSVLRQWQRELASKVSSSAGLRVLVHHGVGRTKSSVDLAAYDVVLTTFAVVGLEVTTRWRGAANGNGNVNGNGNGAAAATGSSDDDDACEVVEPSAPSRACWGGAIGGVEWFRVILDEAQSVKNSRSQIAVAVSAVSAQRRWCLSGTPLQNNVDDLFSYFRFLRYDPYGEPGAFRAMIKEPIRVDPATGFRRLQAILRAVMLRRTKQSRIAGEPIVRLPPRTVVHCRRDFLPAEARAYARLQEEYRGKMEEFAAAGTVSSNYVNLLHMLLRMRQACNHPSMVGGRPAGWEDCPEATAGAVAEIIAASEKVTGAATTAARRLPAALRGMMRAAAENGGRVCGICGDPPQDPAIASCCTQIFCRDCVSPFVAVAGARAEVGVDGFLCPACGTALTPAHIHSAAALVAAERNSRNGADAATTTTGGGAPRGSERGRASGAGAGAGSDADASALMTGTKVRGIMEYLTALKAKHAAATAAAKAKGNKSRAARAGSAAAAVAKGTQLRRGIRSSDAALAAALPPLAPVCAPGAARGARRPGPGGAAPPPEKAIVFSQWTAMLDLLEPCLKSAGIHFRRLDGTMSLTARERALSEFEEKPDVTVILMSLKAAGLGVNLTCANHVILSDVWWNPTVEEQAIDRAHRIGQMREVKVVRFTVRGTVEDRILALQDRKRAMVAAAFGEDNEGCVRRAQLTLEDLVFLFGSGGAASPGNSGAAGGAVSDGGNVGDVSEDDHAGVGVEGVIEID